MTEKDKMFDIGGAFVDGHQMAQLYFGLGITPWTFMQRDPFELKEQIEASENRAKQMMTQMMSRR